MNPALPVLGLAGSALFDAAAELDLRCVAGAFADRAYRPDGRLVTMGADAEPIPISLMDLIGKRIRVIGSQQNGPEYLYEALDFVATETPVPTNDALAELELFGLRVELGQLALRLRERHRRLEVVEKHFIHSLLVRLGLRGIATAALQPG